MNPEKIPVPNTLKKIESLNVEERYIGSTQIIKERLKIGEVETNIQTIRPGRNVTFSLAHDKDFTAQGVVMEPSGLLIDQVATTEKLGRGVGKTPEEFMANESEKAVGICPSNWGWQKSAFFIENGKLIRLKNDTDISGTFSLISLEDGSWKASEIQLENGEVGADSKEKIEKVKIGFSMPLIIREEKLTDPKEIISDPRLLADMRNMFDFAGGKKLPNEFWILLRKLLPSTEVAGKRLVDKRPVVVSKKDALTDEEINTFQNMITEYHLTDTLQIDTAHGRSRLAIIGGLSEIKIPAVGIGFDKDGQLIVVTADGRQKNSAGVSIDELAEIMKEKGAVSAGLGCAGGDVAIAAKIDGTVKILNSPSNTRPGNTEYVTRKVPSMLVLTHQ